MYGNPDKSGRLCRTHVSSHSPLGYYSLLTTPAEISREKQTASSLPSHWGHKVRVSKGGSLEPWSPEISAVEPGARSFY